MFRLYDSGSMESSIWVYGSGAARREPHLPLIKM